MIEKLLRLEGPAVRDVIGVPADRREDRRERLRIALAMIGNGLAGGQRTEDSGQRYERRKRMLEDLAAEGDEAAAQEWFELYGKG